MSKDIVISTRPIEDARLDIDVLERSGISALAAPMLEIKPLLPAPMMPAPMMPAPMMPAPSPPDSIDAVVLTSRHAAVYVDAAYHGVPCYCVGGETGRAASAAGFEHVIVNSEAGGGGAGGGTGGGGAGGGTGGGGTGSDLVRLLGSAGLRCVYWPSGVDIGFDLSEALLAYGIRTVRVAVYKAEFVSSWSPQVSAAFRGERVGAVLIHSARSGQHFNKMLEKHDEKHDEKHGQGCSKRDIIAVVISRRVADLCGGGWGGVVVAEAPRRVSMLRAVAEVLGRPLTEMHE